MTASAPAAIAFAMSPEDVMPPSAITGDAVLGGDARAVVIAVICGTPTPATTRVVQIEPGPMPTFTASAPASISAAVASAVAMFPATTSTRAARLDPPHHLEHAGGVAVRRVDDEHVRRPRRRAPPRARARPGPTPTAAPTRSRPCSSFVACGYSIFFWMSLTVMRPLSRPVAVDDGQLLDLVAVEDLLGLARASCRRAR